MRFRISHLLVTTTIASVYAAVAGAYLARDGFSGNVWELLASPMSLLWLFWLIGEPVCKRFVNWCESNDASGPETQTFYYRKAVWQHPSILAVFLLLSLPGLLLGKATLHWSLVPVFVLLHISCELTQRVQFNDRGVFSSKGVMLWSDYRISLREDPPRLVCWREPNTERLAPTLVPLPDGCADEVHKILAARQPEIEAQT